MKEKRAFKINNGILFIFTLLWGGLVVSYFLKGTLYISNSLPYIVDLFVFVIIALYVYATGFFIYNNLKLDCPTKIEEAVYCCAFGIGFTAYLVLLVGLLGLLYKSVFYSVFIISALILSPYIYRYRKVQYKKKKENPIEGFDKYWILFLCTVLFLLCLSALINTLAPVLTYDTMVYHYGLPNIFIQNHKISYLSENIFSGFPLTIQMLFTLGSLLRGYEVANLFQYGISILFLLSVYSFTRRYYDHTTALVAACLLLSSPMVAHNFSRPAADMGLALFLCLGLFSLITWFDHRKDQWFVTSALCTGIAMGIKYTALFFGLGFLIFIILGKLLSEKISFQKILFRLGLFLFVSLAVASPWYIKNWITTGNPFFPAFYSLFGGEDYSAAMALRQLGDAHHIGVKVFKDIFVLPLKLLTDPYTYGNPVGPVALFCWPFLFILNRRNAVMNYLIIYIIISYLLWVYSFQQMRFFIAGIGIASMLSAVVLEELRRTSKKYMHYTAILCVVVIITLNVTVFLYQSRITRDPLPVVFGAVSKSDYLKKRLSVFAPNWFFEFENLYNEQKIPPELAGHLFDVIEYANQNLCATDKILFVGETMHAYLKKPYICNSAFNQNILLTMLQENISAENAAKKLSTMGITHILFNPDELMRLHYQGYSYTLDRNTLNHLRDFIKRQTKLLFKAKNIVILKLAPCAELSSGDSLR